MVRWLNHWLEPMSTLNHWPGACAAPVLHRVAALPSRALPGEPPGSVADAVAVQPVRLRSFSPYRLSSWMDHQLADAAVSMIRTYRATWTPKSARTAGPLADTWIWYPRG